MEDQQKILLPPKEETLLITLYSRAATCPESILADENAQAVFAQVDFDFEQLHVPTGTRLTICLRARKFDDIVVEFLDEHPRGLVLHLGCGLDTRYFRVDNGKTEWYDLDFPSVIELREKFFQETERYHTIRSSVTDMAWIEKIPKTDDAALILAEGLLMYLEEDQVLSLIDRLKSRFPGSILAFDAFSTLTARNIHRNPSMKATGATVRWGIDEPEQIERWVEGVQLLEEWFFVQSEHIRAFGIFNRMIFKLAGLFSVANKAHRILQYKL